MGMGLGEAFGSLYAANRYKPYKPDRPNLKWYEGKQRSEIGRLYEDRPYDQPGLGFSPEVMGARASVGRDLSRGARIAAKQRTMDRFVRPGGLGTKSGEFEKAMQMQDTASIQSAGEIKRRNLIANAAIKRRDLSYRLGQVTGAYQYGVNTLNRAEQNKYVARSRAYEGLGQGIRTAVQSIWGGSMGA